MATNMASDDILEQHIRSKPKSLEAHHYRETISNLQPLNRRIVETVLTHTDLIDGDFPECLHALEAHVIQMDSLLLRWKQKDFSVMFPLTPYPTELNRWAGGEFARLRSKQRRLLWELQGSAE